MPHTALSTQEAVAHDSSSSVDAAVAVAAVGSSATDYCAVVAVVAAAADLGSSNNSVADCDTRDSLAHGPAQIDTVAAGNRQLDRAYPCYPVAVACSFVAVDSFAWFAGPRAVAVG